MYKRVLLKLSGEQLAGEFSGGIDPKVCKWLAGEVKKAVETGAQVVIMVGGGNFARGRQLVDGISTLTAHKLGILGIVMNAMALRDIFNSAGLDTRAMSSVIGDPFIEPFSHHKAEDYLAKGQVVIAIGAARPYLTSDTGAVLMALELNCEAVLKATKVEGVYDKDPSKHTDANKLHRLSHHEALQNDDITVMDKSAIGLALEHHMPIIVFKALGSDNLKRLVKGEAVGTVIAD